MRRCNDTVHICSFCIWKICYIFLYFSTCQCFFHIIITDEQISGKIQDNNAIFHHCHGVFINHFPCIIYKWCMYGNKITFLKNFFSRFYNLNRSLNAQSAFHGKIRIRTIHFHSQRNTDICHQPSDGTQTDNSQFLAF